MIGKSKKFLRYFVHVIKLLRFYFTNCHSKLERLSLAKEFTLEGSTISYSRGSILMQVNAMFI